MPQKRVCGTCTACCKTHQVLSIEKPGGEWCRHCEIGVGCRIHAQRPGECQDFKCQWLMGYGEDNERPDITQVVIDFCVLKPTGQKTVSLWEVEPGSLKSFFVQEETRKLFWQRIPLLHIYLDGRQILQVPPETDLSAKSIGDLSKAGVEIFRYPPIRTNPRVCSGGF